MSKLHFANLSFDEKSSDTLRENEKYLRFCLINIYFFYINKISRSQATFGYFFFFFLSDCGLSTEVANTLYRGGNTNLCVCLAQLRAGDGPGTSCGADQCTSVPAQEFVFVITKAVVV